jgi:hypothetical protein
MEYTTREMRLIAERDRALCRAEAAEETLRRGRRRSLWRIPRERIAELSASDLAALRMCRMVTIFLVIAAVWFVVQFGLMIPAVTERDHLRIQVRHCGSAEIAP